MSIYLKKETNKQKEEKVKKATNRLKTVTKFLKTGLLVIKSFSIQVFTQEVRAQDKRYTPPT